VTYISSSRSFAEAAIQSIKCGEPKTREQHPKG
jgi:hypothetical protein